MTNFVSSAISTGKSPDTGYPEIYSEAAARASVGGKYKAAGSKLVKSSVPEDWHGAVAAEIYRHGRLDCQSFLQPVTEVVINLRGTANFRRRATGPEQKFTSRVGSASICPSGVEVSYLHIDCGPLDLLHVFIPTDLFGTLRNTDGSAIGSGLAYQGGIHDPLIQSIGFAVAEELLRDDARDQQSRLLIDSLGIGLAGRLLQRYTGVDRRNFTRAYFEATSGRGLDKMRLERVCDYIRENVDRDISLDDVAGIACLSVFHFCRAFKAATGSSPFQYISNMRIDKAKALLGEKNVTIEEIALSAGFSSGANLARAFKKAVGLSPSEYRTHQQV
ncbi:helix-turn-helix domain-containing protein [Shinella sp. M27]|uniref:AraC family transcriptional regulator n=1 Tax=Shinella sp. M27 TaxID=3368614 RepID=UPI003BA3A2DC